MSALAQTAAEESPVGGWLFRIGLALLAIVAAPFLYRGILHWRADDAARATAESFFQALADNRKSDAFQLLASDYRRQIEQDWQPGFNDSWQKSDGLTIRTLQSAVTNDQADVQVSISKDGFSIKPRLKLQRSPVGHWRIMEITQADVDPRWKRYQEREAEQADESTARELQQQLDAAGE